MKTKSKRVGTLVSVTSLPASAPPFSAALVSPRPSLVRSSAATVLTATVGSAAA